MYKQFLIPMLVMLLLSTLSLSAFAENEEFTLELAGELDIEVCVQEKPEENGETSEGELASKDDLPGVWYEEAGIAGLWDDGVNLWTEDSKDELSQYITVTFTGIEGIEQVYDAYSAEMLVLAVAHRVYSSDMIYTVDEYTINFEYDKDGKQASATRTINVIDCSVQPVEGEDVEPEGEEPEVEGEEIVDPEEGEALGEGEDPVDQPAGCAGCAGCSGDKAADGSLFQNLQKGLADWLLVSLSLLVLGLYSTVKK